MKTTQLISRILFLISIFFSLQFAYAQPSQKFSYQAVIRNASNALVTNSNVGVKISILQGSVSGAVIYSEAHTATTNANGLVSLQIGGGTIITGNILNVNWGEFTHFLKVETDPTGGTNYTIVGTNEVLSIPIATMAMSSKDNQWDLWNGAHIRNNNSGTVSVENKLNVGHYTPAPLAQLDVFAGDGDVASFDGGNNAQLTLRENGTIRGQIGSHLATDIDFSISTPVSSSGSIHLAPQNTPHLTLVSGTGNIGVGTTTPTSKFDVFTSGANVAKFNGGTNMQIDFQEGGVTRGQIGSFLGGPNDISLSTPVASTGSIHLATQNTPNITLVSGTGNVGIGTTTPTTKMEINGFTKLGSDAPAIKTKLLTGVTPSIQDGQIDISHNLDSTKIVAVSVLVQPDFGNYIPPSFTVVSGFEYNFYVTPLYIRINTKAGNSSAILNKTIKILITYQE